MKFASTRGEAPQVGFSQALLQGLAPDGGLYVPTQWPAVAAGIEAGEPLPAVGQHLIGAFAAGDALEAAVKKALETATGGEVRGSTPEEMGLLVRSEITKWSKVIDEAKIARID